MTCRIHPRREGPGPAWSDHFRDLPVALVSDAMERLQGAGTPLRAMHGGGMVGPAFTVKTRPGDNPVVHKALDLAEPGDVVVVDAGGALDNATVGELMVSYAARRGLAGLVVDGAIRDSAVLSRGSFPVFAAGVTHRGPYKNGPGLINVPVAVGGMMIAPGDLVCGDADGLVAISPEDVTRIWDIARRKQAAEARLMKTILAGGDDRSWIDRALSDVGCVYVET